MVVCANARWGKVLENYWLWNIFECGIRSNIFSVHKKISFVCRLSNLFTDIKLFNCFSFCFLRQLICCILSVHKPYVFIFFYPLRDGPRLIRALSSQKMIFVLRINLNYFFTYILCNSLREIEFIQNSGRPEGLKCFP